MDEDLKERQENEVIVLKSIYLDDLVDLTNEQQNTHYKKKQQSPLNNDILPPVIRITLKPQNSESQCDVERHLFVKIDMKVKITPNYPNELPKLFLENEKGLSTDQIKELHRLLVKKANTLMGTEMIYELCSAVQEYLYLNNHPPAKSFYDQRLENKLNLEKEQLECHFDEKKKDEEQLLAQIDFAVDLKKKMLQLERKREKELERRERLSSNNTPNHSRRDRERSRSNNKSESESREILSKKPSIDSDSQSDSFELKEFSPFQIEFNEPTQYFKIKCIKLMRYEKENSFRDYLGIDLKTNEMYTIYEWQINLAKNNIFDEKKLESCEIEMHKLEEEFKRLIRLNNKLIFKYYAYKFFRVPNKKIYTVQICMEYLEGNTLELLTNQQHSYAIPDNTLKIFAVQLLEALDYLHSNNIFHRDFKMSCVYLVKNSTQIKLSNYSLVKRLNDLNSVVSNEAATICQGNQKSDIHQMGIILLSLKLCESVKNYHPQIPTHFPPELKSFFSICINENNPRQLQKFDCKSLKSHPFILKNHDTDKAVPVTRTHQVSRRRRVSSHFDDEDDEDEDIMNTFTDYPLQSRLNTEFEVIGVVGQGAFGEVLKVKNKLDSRFYAIKRIRTNPNSRQYNNQIIREIKLLSRLNHENVVRYYSTWAERYEEVYETVNKRRKRTQSQESESPKSTSQLVRFRKLTENNDHEDNLSTSSDDSTAGAINWCKTENDIGDRDFSSISGSALGIKQFSSGSSCSSEGFYKTEIENSKFQANTDDDIEFEDEDESQDEEEEIFRKKNLKEKKDISPHFYLENKKDDTDDSVIFAENSSDQMKSQSSKSSLEFTLRGKSSSRDMEDSNDDDDSENEDENDDAISENENSKVNRQFIYIQMEYCGGKTLKYLIEQGLYNDEEKVWCLLREILQGLHHIHDQGMIHRDLKPGNVLIDKNGHAKLADFGLATSKFLLNTQPAGSGEAGEIHRQNSQNFQDPNLISSTSNQNIDSISLSGAVGTALYVAPELLVPFTKNKFFYTHKVDIYSLGVMFYEMCFPFSTNMERIHVIQNLRQKTIDFNENIDKELFEKQIFLIKEMLNHDPIKRPSAKDLLLNDMIPRKADEIALDELLKTSLAHKQSTNYNKILKAVFDQKNSKVDDFSFDAENLRNPSSFHYLQVREQIHEAFVNIFHKYGGYLITYPLLMPWNDMCNDFNKSFKLTDSSGTVLCLPYNHRIPFARYLARTGCTNIRRYHIGPVYQVMIEKLKLTSLHPKEHVEASFDIVTPSHADCLPEIEILSIINDILNSFPELINSENEFKLIVNHTSIINAIMLYCGINPNQHKQIYYLLTDFNNKLIKSQDASKENRFNWFKDRLPKLDLNEHVTERLLNFLLKYGTAEKVLSELKSLTKSESQFSKLAKEGISQLKLITQNANIIDFKIPITVSTSLTLPVISHPYEYSGFIFQLLIQKNKRKNEFDILASGGRYDKLISFFKTTETTKQCAVGVSFDFEKLVSIINNKSKKNVYRPELVVCSIGLNQSSINNLNAVVSNTASQIINRKQKSQLDISSSNSNNYHDIRNRLRLFKQFSMLNKNMNICTSIAHEKFQSIDEMDEYCKKYCINSYVFLKESSSTSTQQIFLENPYRTLENTYSNSSIANPSSSVSSEQSTTQYLKIRSLVNRGIKFIEKKINLLDFLHRSNSIINNMTSFNSLNSTQGMNIQPFSLFFNFNQTNPLFQTVSTSSNSNINTYADYISSSIANCQLSSNTYPPATPNILSNSTNSIGKDTNVTPSFTSNNSMAQVNITILIESSSRQQSNERNPSRKKIEVQLLSKINHVLTLFNSKTRIELIAMEVQDNVIHCLANGLRLDMDEHHFRSNWNQCLEKLNNVKNKRQLHNFKFDEIIYDLRYVKKSKVFILFSTKSDQYKLLVIP